MAFRVLEKPQQPSPDAVHGPGHEHDAGALPRVEIDARLGELVDGIEVNTNYFADLMASKGVSAHDIAQTTMFISADTIADGDPHEDSTITEGGRYDPTDRSVRINIGSVLAVIGHMKREPETHGQIEGKRIDEVGSSLASEFALHELSHRIDMALGVDDYQEWLDYHDDFVPEKLLGRIVRRVLRMSRNPEHHEIADLLRRVEVGRAALKSVDHEQYRNAPEEQRAHKLSDEEIRKLDKEGEYPIAIAFKEPSPQPVD